jgi:ribosomal protein L3 glutamine methyltransferase
MAQKKNKKTKLPDIKIVTRDLATLRDYLRYAVSRFNEAELYYGHGTFTPWDEAVFLCLEALKLPIEQLEPYLDARLLPAEKKCLAELIHARVTTRKPVPYLVNKTYLKGVPFYVDERVIVPRSYIADLLFDEILDNEGYPLIEDPYAIESVLDLCTGSGCLAILAAHVFPAATVDAVDLSKDALAVAKINVDACLHSDRITLYQGDLFAPLKGKKYDFIITNPPYVDAEDMKGMPQEYLHEPSMALAGVSLGKGKGLAAGRDGMDLVRKILKEAPKYLSDGGRLLCEIGYGREALEDSCPEIPFLWLDTENSASEVFWLTKEQLEKA